MSKISVITGLTIKRPECIRAAVEKLRGIGVNVELLENVSPRMYFDHHHPNN